MRRGPLREQYTRKEPLSEQCMNCTLLRYNTSNAILLLLNRIVKALAEFHTVKLPENVLQNAQSERFTVLNALLHNANSTFKQEMKNKLDNYDFKLGLVHGDLNMNNFIFNAHDNFVHLIDYEKTFYGWVAYDWAGPFGELTKCLNLRKQLLEVYLKHVAELEGHTKSTNITRADIDKFYQQVVLFDRILEPFQRDINHCNNPLIQQCKDLELIQSSLGASPGLH